MSKTTANLNLTKLELTDVADITLLNDNWDKLDNEINKLDNEINELGKEVDSKASQDDLTTLEQTFDEKLGNIDLSEITNQIDELDNNKLGKNETAVSCQKLATPVTINGVEFDGTKNIVVSNITLV